MAGATSDAILVNLILDGELEALLREWRTSTPPMSYEKIAEEINARIAEVADKFGAPTRTFTWPSVYRWVNDFYRITR